MDLHFQKVFVHEIPRVNNIFISQKNVYIATLGFMHYQFNHQATNSKKYKLTTIVLKTTNPYLPDRVEFKHQFVKSKAGHVIFKNNVLTPSIICW